jgi:hypothetical protein
LGVAAYSFNAEPFVLRSLWRSSTGDGWPQAYCLEMLLGNVVGPQEAGACADPVRIGSGWALNNTRATTNSRCKQVS